jgi:hypothetical protein
MFRGRPQRDPDQSLLIVCREGFFLDRSMWPLSASDSGPENSRIGAPGLTLHDHRRGTSDGMAPPSEKLLMKLRRLKRLPRP